MDCPAFIDPDTWAAFLLMRKLKGQRAPFTEFAAKKIINKLQEFHEQGFDADHILSESVVNGWSGVFIGRDTPKRNPDVKKTADLLASYEEARQTMATPEDRRRIVGETLRRVR